MLKKTLLVLTLSFAAGSFAHANLSVICTAYGNATAQSGGTKLPTLAKIEFDAEDFDASTDQILVIRGVKGRIQVGNSKDLDLKDLNEENSYIGLFDFDTLQSNPKYKPRKYKNMLQFADFDANETLGQEDGMWGQFLIDKNLGDGCEAKYIFQAGDHMGGTIHMTCKVQD